MEEVRSAQNSLIADRNCLFGFLKPQVLNTSFLRCRNENFLRFVLGFEMRWPLTIESVNDNVRAILVGFLSCHGFALRTLSWCRSQINYTAVEALLARNRHPSEEEGLRRKDSKAEQFNMKI
jgi:hypothetical protein